MNVQIRNGYEKENSFHPDLRVVVDVFRASTTALAILEKKPCEYLIANDLQIIQKFSAQSFRVVSEVFDLGIDNSPSLVRQLLSSGEAVIHKTANLTTAIEQNFYNGPMLMGCFNNLNFLVEYIHEQNFQSVEIIPAGLMAEKSSTPEDTHCAELMKSKLLTGHHQSPDLELLLGDFEAKRKKYGWSPHFVEDLKIAVILDLSSIIPEISRRERQIFSARNVAGLKKSKI